MQAVIVKGDVYLVKDNQLFPVKTKGSELETRLKLYKAHMDLYCTNCGEPNSSEVEEGRIYTISE